MLNIFYITLKFFFGEVRVKFTVFKLNFNSFETNERVVSIFLLYKLENDLNKTR